MDVATECSEVSIEGTTFLEGKRGEGNYTISFDNIEQISFRMNADRLTGMVKLRDGGTSELTLNKTQKAYGRTKYGTFQIKLIGFQETGDPDRGAPQSEIKSQGPEQPRSSCSGP